MNKKMTQKNPVVLRIEHGHPGYVVHQIIATQDDLRGLVTDVLQHLDSTGGKTGRLKSIGCTLANERADHVYVSFHTATAEDVERLHERLIGRRIRKGLGCAYQILAFCLAAYGIYRLLGN
jgi:hypothetical protein